jgi:predicted kinase
MQEINYARQESRSQRRTRKEYKCRVCDGPVEWPDFVCRKCWYRDQKEQEWESYLEFMGSDDPARGHTKASAKDDHGQPGLCEQTVLIVLCGPSHAGKSTFARRIGSNFTIVSSDRIRKKLANSFKNCECEDKVWKIFEAMKRKALKDGCNVILDACHLSEEARRHSLEGPNHRHRKICVVFDLPWGIIRDRWLKEKRTSLEEVKRMWRDFQKNNPTAKELKCEGFDEVYFVREWPLAMQSRGILRMAHHPGEAGRLSALLSAFLPVIDFFLLHTSCAHASAHTFCFAASPPWLCRSKADGSLRQFRFGGVSLWKKSKMQSKKAVLRAAQQCMKSWLRKETTP